MLPINNSVIKGYRFLSCELTSPSGVVSYKESPNRVLKEENGERVVLALSLHLRTACSLLQGTSVGPSNFPAATILNYDVVVHCRTQAPVKRKMATTESSVSNPLASSRNIRVIISQNQARMRCNWMRMSPKDFRPLIGVSLRKARLPYG